MYLLRWREKNPTNKTPKFYLSNLIRFWWRFFLIILPSTSSYQIFLLQKTTKKTQTKKKEQSILKENVVELKVSNLK